MKSGWRGRKTAGARCFAPRTLAQPSVRTSVRSLANYDAPTLGSSQEHNAPVIKRLSNCPACEEQPLLYPILKAEQDGLPFAVSLELCSTICTAPPDRELSSSVCELLYFLHGEGEVAVQLPGQRPWFKAVSAGDSVFAPCHTITVQADSRSAVDLVGTSHSDGATLAFLRVYLPINYVLEFIKDSNLVSTCRDAAIEATSHWNDTGDKCLSPDSVSSIMDNAKDISITTVLSQARQKDPGPNANPVATLDAESGHQPPKSSGPFAPKLPKIDVYSSLDANSGGNGARHEPDTSWPQHSLNEATPVRTINVLDAPTYQLPDQQNRLALVLDPIRDHVPFTFGVEIFPAHHRTPPHVHNSAHEMFFILSGKGTGFCNGEFFPVQAGDCVVFPPGVVHGINTDEKMYCLELMLPNEQFAEFVRRGTEMEDHNDDDSCILAAVGCK